MITNIDRWITAIFSIFIFYLSYLSYTNNSYIGASILALLASYLLVASIIPHRFITEEVTGNLLIELIRFLFEIIIRVIAKIISH